MARYVLCPRCELNYIDADQDEYCEVCLKELKGEKTFSDDFESEESEVETELCPICGENYMALGEKMCEECKKKSDYQDDVLDEDMDKDDESWRSYLDDEEPDLGIDIPAEVLDDLDEEEEEELEEEEVYEEEDFEYASADDYDPDEDDEDDEDEDEDF